MAARSVGIAVRRISINNDVAECTLPSSRTSHRSEVKYDHYAVARDSKKANEVIMVMGHRYRCARDMGQGVDIPMPFKIESDEIEQNRRAKERRQHRGCLGNSQDHNSRPVWRHCEESLDRHR